MYAHAHGVVGMSPVVVVVVVVAEGCEGGMWRG